MILSDAEKKDLQRAKNLLENPGVAARITNALGMPIERGLKYFSNSRYPSVIRASQTCEGFDFCRHKRLSQALKACPNTA
jgi:hypothetical protein